MTANARGPAVTLLSRASRTKICVQINPFLIEYLEKGVL